ncbi:M56 family metallopeptidase [Kitasatospora cineracea]|uniref:Peptidase M48-like protein n=1 Tax=Kitasatospora cineracea TaxID=88074 RepID=A0A3N4RTI6_9ACTN|nr:M56 family metallopeptidase [Kitasatospora cineracea]RPE36712.1 peptidase M48-like protein [Kitasatospora cineracea]
MIPALLLVGLPVGLLLLGLPFAGVPAVRRLAGMLPPREAAGVLAGGAVLMAAVTVAALVALFQVPFLAVLERVPFAEVVARWPAALPVSTAAGAVLAVRSWALVARWRRQRALLVRAWTLVSGEVPADGTPDGAAAGDVLVVADDRPEAFALPGLRSAGGRVVVSTGMLRILGPAEREVLLAHERAHLTGRHRLLSAVVDLAGAVHPAVRGLGPALGFQLERWADEAAAARVGDRRLAAAALARAALAAGARPDLGPDRGPVLAVGTGPVPRRVAALLGPVPQRPRGRAARAGAWGLAVAVSGAAVGLAAAYGLHEYVEYAARALTTGR